MKILQVTPYFAPAWSYGGPPRTVYKLSRALANRGNEITVLTTDALSTQSRAPRASAFDGLRTIYLRNLSNYLASKHQLFLPLGLNSYLRRHAADYDVLHVHMFRTYQNIAARGAALKSSTPYIFSAHGTVPRIVGKKVMKTVFDELIGLQFLKDASALIAVSKAEARQYGQFGVSPDRIAVIYNGVDGSDYASLPPRGSFVHGYGLDRKRIITYVGRLNARKGLEVLVEAFAELTRQRDDLALVLVGPDDGFRSTVERLVRRAHCSAPIVLPGFIPMPEELGVFVDSDVIVYPGVHEIFGLVPFEALLCNRPVVVGNDSGCGEIIAEAKGGLTVPIGDVSALANAISATLSGGAGIADSVSRGRAYVLKRMNWDGLAAETERVYERVIQGA